MRGGAATESAKLGLPGAARPGYASSCTVELHLVLHVVLRVTFDVVTIRRLALPQLSQR